ncbi:MAG: hypothetical protein OEY56_10125 [Cyclobacteriaceae bacterium]|nr:hypothetical protein [Cyclobacteriaceae bacterium]
MTKAQSQDFTTGNDTVLAAALAYERMYFESGNDSFLLRKAYSYKQTGNYTEELRVLARINNPTFDLYYEKALAYFFLEEYESCQQELLRAQYIQGESTKNVVILRILSLIATRKWGEARQEMLTHNEMLGISAEEVDRIVPAKVKPKNTQRAYNLSLWMPGTGQMYAGHFGKGMVSGGIQAGLVGFNLYSFVKGYYFTGTLSGVALFYTFYLGGARYAMNLSEMNNEKKGNQISERFIGYIK